MGKELLVMIFGVWVALQSFLGFPLVVDEIVYVILGLCLLGLGVLLRRDGLARRGHIHTAETFVENEPEPMAPIAENTSTIEE